MINCMGKGVMVTNRNLEVVLHNPALMRLLEIQKAVENPVSISEIVNDESLIKTLKQIQEGKVKPFDKERVKRRVREKAKGRLRKK